MYTAIWRGQENPCKSKELIYTGLVAALNKKEQTANGWGVVTVCLTRCTFPALAHSVLTQPSEIETIMMTIF